MKQSSKFLCIALCASGAACLPARGAMAVPTPRTQSPLAQALDAGHPAPGAHERAVATSVEGPGEQIREAIGVVHAMQHDPETAELLKRAYGVFIVPDYARAALGVGVQAGAGVFLRRRDGHYGNPAFYRLWGVSVGPQAGVAVGPVALVLLTPRAAQQFMSERRFSINFDLALAVGEYNSREQASAGKLEDIVLWSGAAGAYAGLSFGVTEVAPDERANETYYGRPDITPLEILAGRTGR